MKHCWKSFGDEHNVFIVLCEVCNQDDQLVGKDSECPGSPEFPCTGCGELIKVGQGLDYGHPDSTGVCKPYHTQCLWGDWGGEADYMNNCSTRNLS